MKTEEFKQLQLNFEEIRDLLLKERNSNKDKKFVKNCVYILVRDPLNNWTRFYVSLSNLKGYLSTLKDKLYIVVGKTDGRGNLDILNTEL